MLRTALIVSLVALVAGQDAPTDVVTNPDCYTDVECRLTDGGAMCQDGVCDCSDLTDNSRFCTAGLKDVIKIIISFIFSGVDCNMFKEDPAAEERLRTSLLGSAVFEMVGYDILCGSVIFLTTVNAPGDKLDQVLAEATASVKAAQADIPLLENATLTTGVVVGDTQQCPVANAVTTLLVEGVCVPDCRQGYARVEIPAVGNGTKSYECQAPSEDDDLTATGVAAVVVAVMLFCGIAAACVYYFTGKPNSDVPLGDVENEPFNEEKPADTNGPLREDQPNDITV